MLGFPELIASIREIVAELSNVAGLIEKNVQSYDRMENRSRQKKLLSQVETILRELVYLRTSNKMSLWHIARWAQINETELIDDLQYVERGNLEYNRDISEFLIALRRVKALVEDYSSGLIRHDFKLFEQLSDALDRRIYILEIVLFENGKPSPDRLIALHAEYRSMVETMSKLKDSLATLIAAGDPTPSAR